MPEGIYEIEVTLVLCFKISRYYSPFYSRKTSVKLIAVRGCPGHCSCVWAGFLSWSTELQFASLPLSAFARILDQVFIVSLLPVKIYCHLFSDWKG